jgi:hypothetical protein
MERITVKTTLNMLVSGDVLVFEKWDTARPEVGHRKTGSSANEERSNNRCNNKVMGQVHLCNF